MEGNDHKVSLLPDEMKHMVKCIRNVESSLGEKSSHRVLSQGELINRENLAKVLSLDRKYPKVTYLLKKCLK